MHVGLIARGDQTSRHTSSQYRQTTQAIWSWLAACHTGLRACQMHVKVAKYSTVDAVHFATPGTGANYCDEYLCMSDRSHKSKNTLPNFTKFCAHCLWTWLGLPLTVLQYVIYFRFVDNVLFSYHGANRPESSKTLWRSSPGGGISWTVKHSVWSRSSECRIYHISLGGQTDIDDFDDLDMMVIGGQDCHSNSPECSSSSADRALYGVVYWFICPAGWPRLPCRCWHRYNYHHHCTYCLRCMYRLHWERETLNLRDIIAMAECLYSTYAI